ncbi:hypothetical protein [Vibrio astriarenae]|nr:hypothetical protein [Vibrio astriarenae]
MLKKTKLKKVKVDELNVHADNERTESAHKIRKKIEEILLEQEQKKLWEL